MIEYLKYNLYLFINIFYKKIYKRDYIEKNLYYILFKSNWWSNKKYKIDINQKIEYVLLNASYENMQILNKFFKKNKIISIWERIQGNNWDFKKSKKNLINNYLDYVWRE